MSVRRSFLSSFGSLPRSTQLLATGITVVILMLGGWGLRAVALNNVPADAEASERATGDDAGDDASEAGAQDPGDDPGPGTGAGGGGDGAGEEDGEDGEDGSGAGADDDDPTELPAELSPA